ncbi:site-specific DNA-methyltransferase [PVC group bacterium]|nr:site-specific DNA-methyltransferase [PVC group bacterium]
MAERKNTTIERLGGYATPSGAIASQKHNLELSNIQLLGDQLKPFKSSSTKTAAPNFYETNPDTSLFIGDCRELIPRLENNGQIDLVFADPPFNWDVPYDGWKDGMSRDEYERFTFDWLDCCIKALSPTGSLWVNIPDDTVAEVVLHLKRRGMTMINWCVWHFRFGQHRNSSFILSKVHALYFVKNPENRTWNPDAILEQSDRASIYHDQRTQDKPNNKGMRVPMDVWYGKYWGRIQGNNKERRHGHHNQIPEVYLERVILACSNKGDVVLDPFAGSGTTSTVARAHGRRSISIEHSKTNSQSAWQRITKTGMIRKDCSAGQSSAIFQCRKSTC